MADDSAHDSAPSARIPRFHYPDRERETRANRIIQHLQGAGAVVLLTGAEGSGRTHLLRYLLGRRVEGLAIHALRPSPELTLTELLLGALDDLELPRPTGSAPEQIRRTAAEQIATLVDQGIAPVIAVDNAHTLPAELLEGLLAFREQTREGDAPPLGLLLVGDDHLPATVTAAGGTDAMEITLRGFDRSGTAAFVGEALAAAGDTAGHRLERLDLDALHAATDGLPGALLRALREGTSPARTRTLRDRLPVRPGVPRVRLGRRTRWVLLASAATVGVVAALAVLVPGRMAPPETTTEESLDPMQEEPTLVDREFQAAEPEPAPDEPEPEPDPASDAAPDPAVSDREPPPAQDDSPSADVRRPRITDITLLAGLPDDAGEAQADTDAPEATEPEPPEAPPEEPEDTEETAEETPEEAPEESGDPLEQALAAGERWRDAQSPDAWTVQLLGARTPGTVLGWMDDLPDGVEVHLLRTERDGNAWYVVVTGAFEDRDAAREGMAALPEPLRAHGAWVRSLDGL